MLLPCVEPRQLSSAVCHHGRTSCTLCCVWVPAWIHRGGEGGGGGGGGTLLLQEEVGGGVAAGGALRRKLLGGGVEAQSGLKVKKQNKEHFQLCSIITFETTKPAAHFFVPSHKSPKHLGAI